MKTTKRLFVLAMIAVLTVVSFMPSTFSWYPHSGLDINKDEGKKIHYADDLEVSMKTAADTVSLSTIIVDKDGNSINNDLTNQNGINAAANSVVHYKTTLNNTGGDDVIVDLDTHKLPNNADFLIGTTFPTINEKAFASRAVRTKASDNLVRVYFKTHNSMASYWSVDNGDLINETGTYYYDNNQEQEKGTGYEAGSTNQGGTTNDINLSYFVGGKEYQVKMSICPTLESDSNLNDLTGGTNKVYFYDIPSNAEKFFFFNHWYLKSSSNREWNRTLDITDLSAGKLYYLTNNAVDHQWKEYKTREVDTALVALNNYYKSVRMSLGNSVFADIGLKKDSDDEDEEFVPDYFGNTIAYSVQSGSNIVSVNKDGLITPKNESGNAVIRTTITGKFGDTRYVDTSVSIPENIDEIPIIKNVRIPAGESVDIYWYARNKSTDSTMITDALYITI